MRFSSVSAKKFQWQNYIVYISFAIVLVFFSITQYDSGFLTGNNMLNIIRQTAMISIMAVAMTFVIAAGQIDLSVGAITALSALFAAMAINSTNNIFLAFISGIAIGAAVGFVNGVLITKVKLPSFLATLGTMGIIRGLAMWISNTAAIPILNTDFNWLFGTGNIIGNVPMLLIWTIVVLVLGQFAFKKLSFGKKVLATGGNEQAAIFSGVKTDRIKLLVMTIMGIAAAFAGILYAGRMQAGRYTFGDGDELSVIAAVIIGGTSMSGGKGSVIGAVVGSLLMGVINNGLVIAGLDVSQQQIVRGIIIILAVALGGMSDKRK